MKSFHPQIRTKNFSASDLRSKNTGIGTFTERAIVRLGSTTPTNEAFPNSFGRKPIVEINTVDAIENSRSKLRMKNCFAAANVPQANWYTLATNHGNTLFNSNGTATEVNINSLPYPIVAKRVFGFKGHGMVKLDTQADFETWLRNNNTNGYYFEEFKNYSREYRLHCTQTQCFMVWRKLRKADSEQRWFFNSSNCNWVGEEHNLFDRPRNWASIEADCLRAMVATGLDIGSFDVRVQSNQKATPAYILVEVNSAPSLGEQGVDRYREVISQLITNKIASNGI